MAKSPATKTAATENEGVSHSREVKGVADKFHVIDGEEKRNAAPGEEALRFYFSNGHLHEVALATLPENIREVLAWHGLAAKLGDAYAQAKEASVDDKEEAFLAVLERLQSGEWIARGEAAGPRSGVLADAIARVLEENGQTVDEARYASIVEKLRDKTQRDGAMANPQYKAAYEKIRAERQAAKAEEAAKKAAEGEADLGGF